MHNLKELIGKFIVATVTPRGGYLRVNLKGREESFNVVNGIPDEPLENLIRCSLGETSPVLPIRIPA